MSPFLMNVCACVVVIFINNALQHTGGDLAIGAYGIVNRTLMLFVMIVMGITQGMQPIVGYNYGAKQYERVRKTLRYGMTCGRYYGGLCIERIISPCYRGDVYNQRGVGRFVCDWSSYQLRHVPVCRLPDCNFQFLSVDR